MSSIFCTSLIIFAGAVAVKPKIGTPGWERKENDWYLVGSLDLNRDFS